VYSWRRIASESFQRGTPSDDEGYRNSNAQFQTWGQSGHLLIGNLKNQLMEQNTPAEPAQSGR
jgi:hypothetical protein